MKKKRFFSFLKNEVSSISFNSLENNMFFVFLSSFYIIGAVLLILINSINITGLNISLDTTKGLISQLQILTLLYLSLNFKETGNSCCFSTKCIFSVLNDCNHDYGKYIYLYAGDNCLYNIFNCNLFDS